MAELDGLEDLDDTHDGNAAQLIEDLFGEVAAGSFNGLRPGAEVKRHRVCDSAVEVEEVGFEVAFGQHERLICHVMNRAPAPGR